jgi:bloom syndrome protein
VLDEAHCISTWGHEFRPNYLKVKNIKRVFPDIPIAAFTATATEKVNADIRDILQLDADTQIFQSSFIRNNLYLKIKSRGSKKEEVKECLAEIASELKGKYLNQSAILYAFSRNKCEELSNMLEELGIKTDFYHAGLSAKKRNEIQTSWLDGDLQIICATIAFGMGIDKPDVRVVYHFNLPKTIEGYYQEIGRGGRDGNRSDCIFYYNENDPIVYKQMTDKKSKNIRENEGIYREKKLEMARNETQKMYDMIGYVENQTDCRHILLANYFGEKRKEKIGFCGDLCDNCIHFNKMKSEGVKVKKKDITAESKKIIELVGSMTQPYRENVIRKLIGYPKKVPKRKLKKDISGNWNSYKKEYESQKEEIMTHNQEYNVREKQIKRILVKLVVDKYIKIEIIKMGNGVYGSWKEKYLLYRKAQKIMNGEKKIKL